MEKIIRLNYCWNKIEQGYVSITPLQVDLTAYAAQDVINQWLSQARVT